MRLVIAPPERPACRLEKGEARRVPRRPEAPLLGYHICCPQCGWRLFVMHSDDGQKVIEEPDGLTVSPPVICGYCGLEIAVERGEFTMGKAIDAG